MSSKTFKLVRDDEKCAAENDDELFSRGLVSCFGECPICRIPLPTDIRQRVVNLCCMKTICNGCIMAASEVAGHSGSGDPCPFCRTAPPCSDEVCLALIQKRMDAGDAEAFCEFGQIHKFGEYGLPSDISRAVELNKKAAKLGSLDAHTNLGYMYEFGEGLEKDVNQALHHYEISAKGGYPEARFHLGFFEEDRGRMDRALHHWMISTKMGDEDSLNAIKKLYVDGDALKEDYGEALIGYRDAMDAMKSEPRRKALELHEQRYSSKGKAEREKAEAVARAEQAAAKLLQELDLEVSAAPSIGQASGSNTKGQKKKKKRIKKK